MAHVKSAPKRPPVDDTPAAPDWQAELSGLSPEQVASFVIKRVTLLYPRKFSTNELDQVHHLLVTGELAPVTLLEEAYRRLAALDAQGFVDDLKLHGGAAALPRN